jgi:outer membrane murein-binding lipoprotein Lpp
MSEDIPQKKLIEENKEMTLKDLILSIRSYIQFLIKKMWVILGITIVCVILGFFYGRSKKPIYLAETNFILQESGSSSDGGGGGGGLALLGLGGDKKAGLFEGENLKWLYTTRLMLQKALFTNVKRDNKDILLIDWFLDIDKAAKKVTASNPSYKTIKFKTSDIDSSSDQNKNRLVGICVNIIKANYLKVKDLDKTEGVIQVDISSSDEKFAKVMADVLVDNVNNYYVQSKTGKLSSHVNELQGQVDEYNSKMNASLYKTAEAVDAVPYPNPNNQVSMVAPKRKGIDAELNSTIYVQLVKALETNKMELAKATPLIQVIDAPILPLPITSKSASFFIIVFGLVGFMLTCIGLVVYRLFKNVMAS